MAANENILQQKEITGAFRLVFDYLKEQMVAEFIKQGHNVTDSLINSIDKKIIESTVFTRMDVEYNFYGKFVDTGRRAGARRVPIEALEEWIKLKGFETDAKKIKGLAFAIQRTIFEKGISTPQSWSGENTKGWQTKILSKNEERIAADFQNAIGGAFDTIITNVIRDITSRQKNN